MKIERSEFIEKWLEALESGEYKQAQLALRRTDEQGKVIGYCCLGVACDVANKLGLRKKDYFDDGSSFLPLPLAKFIGIDTRGDFERKVKHGRAYYTTLTEANDNGVRFKTIAKIIREQLAKKNFAKS